MKKAALLLVLFFSCEAFSQVSLKLLNDYTITPNSVDTIGVFARTYYHPSRNKFYVVYGARPAGSALPQGQLTNYAWREYDASFNFTGTYGSLPGFTSAGDYAMEMVDSTYYHLCPGGLNYKLSKFDDDFVAQGNVIIPLDSHDSNTDQLMGYGNGRFIIGAFHEPTQIHPTFPMQSNWSPSCHLFQYNTSLSSLATDQYLSPTFYSWGGSATFNSVNNHYEFVSMDSFPTYQLKAYEYDVNMNFLSEHLLSTDGQWSQGLIWDGTYYYLAYHTGGEHRCGNIVVSVWDMNWNQQTSLTITNYPVFPPSPGFHTNAQRPYINKVGNMLYVSYDVETYNYISPNNIMTHFDWEAHVAKVQLNNPTGVLNQELSNGTMDVYPNPVKDNFVLSLGNFENSKSQMEIYDCHGKLIRREEIVNSQTEISLENNFSGVYLIKVILENGKVMTRKLIKE